LTSMAGSMWMFTLFISEKISGNTWMGELAVVFVTAVLFGLPVFCVYKISKIKRSEREQNRLARIIKITDGEKSIIVNIPAEKMMAVKDWLRLYLAMAMFMVGWVLASFHLTTLDWLTSQSVLIRTGLFIFWTILFLILYSITLVWEFNSVNARTALRRLLDTEGNNELKLSKV